MKDINRQLLDSLLEYIFILDQFGIVQYRNSPLTLTKYSADVFSKLKVGSDYINYCTELFGRCTEDDLRMQLGIKDVMTGKKDYFVYEFFHHSDDEMHWFKMRVTPFQNNDNYSVIVKVEDTTEQKLENNRFELAFWGSNQGMWDWDLENSRQYINDQYAKMLGYDLAELKKQPVIWTKLVHPDDSEIVWQSLKDFEPSSDEHYLEWEIRFRHKQGYWKWILSRSKIIQVDENSFPKRLVGIHQDIDKRKKAELELKESEKKFRSYINKAPIGIMLFDEDGSILSTNGKAHAITGYSENELLEMDIIDLRSAQGEKRFPADFEELKKTGEIKREYQFLKKDGSISYARVNAVQISANRFLGFLEDINVAKKISNNLREQKAYFQQLFENSPEAIALLDKEEIIIKVNSSFEELFGYQEKNIVGKRLNHLIIPEDKREEGENITERISAGESFQIETVRQKKNGEKIFVSVLGYPIKLDEDQLGVYAVYNDISKRKKEENKIKYLSFHDQMTGLYNRRYFENEMERMNSSRKLPISILVGDLDGLKKVNDNYGHKEGDRYIKDGANLISKVVRDEDIVARIGGDEFAVILPECAEKVVARIKDRIVGECEEQSVSLSVGFAVKEEEEQDLNEVFKEADRRMYEMKKNKKREKKKRRH